jgi:hypothetical protein
MTKIDKNSLVGLRLAYRFWIELGRPKKYNNRRTMEAWSPKIESLFRKSGLDYMGFKWFLIWALRLAEPDGAKFGNDFTARNLRSAQDPMASLVKQFGMTFFDIFLPKADKVVPLLVEKREQEEAERLCNICSEPALMGMSLCKRCLDEERRAGESEPCTDCGQTAAHGTSLCFDCLDKLRRKQMSDYLMCAEGDDQHLGRRAGESIDGWIDRIFAPLRDPDWRCPNCVYGSNTDPDAERTAWCPDCAEERCMWEDEDREWMCGEVESVSCLTREWD